MLGLHELNAKQYDDAIVTLERAERWAFLQGDDLSVLAYKAWRDFAVLLKTKDQPSLQAFERSVETLQAYDHERAMLYANQLMTAKAFYMPD